MNISRYEIPITIDAVYYDIKPLDKALFLGNVNAVTGASSDSTAGTYYITEVVRQIENKHFFTSVKLNRESVNEVE